MPGRNKEAVTDLSLGSFSQSAVMCLGQVAFRVLGPVNHGGYIMESLVQ